MSDSRLFAIFLIFIGITALVLFLLAVYFYKITIKTWNTVQGEILFYDIIIDNDGDSWKRELIYCYHVDGIHYKSNKYSKNLQVNKPFKYQVELNPTYRTGSSITVYYNPDNPKKSTLDPKFSDDNYIVPFLSAVAFAVAYYIWN